MPQDTQAEDIGRPGSLPPHVLLKITNGHAPLFGTRLGAMEFGDFNDNYEALMVSQYRVAHGEIEEGLTGLCMLRAHVVRSQEIKSLKYLLPVIDESIAHIKMESRPRKDHLAGRPKSEAFDGFGDLPLFM
jgi:hypothetical protein